MGWKLKALSASVALSAAISSGWYIYAQGKTIDELRKDKGRIEADLKASESARWQEHASSMRIYFNETRRIQELEDEKAHLADRLASDAIGLRVNATCPSVPESSTTSPGTNAPAPRLTDSAKRHYRDLRERIIEQRSQIKGLQDYAKEIQKVCGMVKNTPD